MARRRPGDHTAPAPAPQQFAHTQKKATDRPSMHDTYVPPFAMSILKAGWAGSFQQCNALSYSVKAPIDSTSHMRSLPLYSKLRSAEDAMKAFPSPSATLYPQRARSKQRLDSLTGIRPNAEAQQQLKHAPSNRNSNGNSYTQLSVVLTSASGTAWMLVAVENVCTGT